MGVTMSSQRELTCNLNNRIGKTPEICNNLVVELNRRKELKKLIGFVLTGVSLVAWLW